FLQNPHAQACTIDLRRLKRIRSGRNSGSVRKERRVWKSEYRKRFPEGDKLSRIAGLIDWNAFNPILEPLFKNTAEGRPHVDVVLMMKVLVLQSWYGLADEMVESECKDRLPFQDCLGYPASVPN